MVLQWVPTEYFPGAGVKVRLNDDTERLVLWFAPAVFGVGRVWCRRIKMWGIEYLFIYPFGELPVYCVLGCKRRTLESGARCPAMIRVALHGANQGVASPK